MQEYLDSSAQCRTSLFSIRDCNQIDTDKFMHSLKYVLQFKMGRPVILYDCKNGLLDFSINSVKFKLVWPPIDNVTLTYSHIEGTRVFDTQYEISCEDPLYELIKLVEFYTLYARPNDI